MHKLKLTVALLNFRDIQRACLGYQALKIISKHEGTILTISEIGKIAETDLNLACPHELLQNYADEKTLGPTFTVHYSVIHAIVKELVKQKLVEPIKDKISYKLTPMGKDVMSEWDGLLKKLTGGAH